MELQGIAGHCIYRALVILNVFLAGDPPPNCVLRAMCIHSAAENIAENLICCPKHTDINQKKLGINYCAALYYGRGRLDNSLCISLTA